MRQIALIPGDGIGPEVTAEAQRVLIAVIERSDLDLNLVQMDKIISRSDHPGFPFLPSQLEELIESYHAVLLGTFENLRAPFNRAAYDPVAELSRKLDLFVQYHPVHHINNRLTPLKPLPVEDVQFVVFNHNLEGFSDSIGGIFQRGTGSEISLQNSIYSSAGIERFLRHVFDFTRQKGFKRIDLCGLWRGLCFEADLFQRVFSEILTEFTDIEVNHADPIGLMHQMLTHPEKLEVIVTNHFSGEFISGLAAELQGGSGFAASGYLNPGRLSLFRPLHGARTALAGKGAASPIAAIKAAALLLESLGYDQEAGWIHQAVRHALQTENISRDSGGRLKTRDVGQFIADYIHKGSKSKS